MKFNPDRTLVGLAAGLVGPWLGLVVFYLILFNERPFATFIQMIIHNSATHSGTIAVSLVFNLLFFFGALHYHWYHAARGVILAMFIYAPFVVYFKYAA